MTLDADVAEFCAENGYLTGARHPDGRYIALAQMITTWDIVLGDRYSVAERWTYEELADAAIALVDWQSNDFADEPDGWIRHRPSDRRRPDGDASREFIRP